ncbi:hypothetical protein PAENIP36_43280 [Paenibacillus sp. P36]
MLIGYPYMEELLSSGSHYSMYEDFLGNITEADGELRREMLLKFGLTMTTCVIIISSYLEVIC